VPYVKTSVRTTRSGTVRYLQLAHNEWDAEAQRSRTRVLYNFGREDELDKDAARLIAQLEEVIDGTDALAPAERGRLEGSLAARPGLKRFLRVTPSGMHAVARRLRPAVPISPASPLVAHRDAPYLRRPGHRAGPQVPS